MATREETRGRPRDPEVDRVILETTMRHLLERGYADLSIEAVAADAGVGKTTIYRRYPKGKLDLVLDAITTTHIHLNEIPDTGSIKGDLIALFDHPHAFELIAGPGCTMLGSVLAEKDRNPDLIAAFRKAVTEPRQRQLDTIVGRAKERGEVRADVDPGFVGQMVFGTMLARNLMGKEVSLKVLEQAVDQVVSGIAPR